MPRLPTSSVLHPALVAAALGCAACGGSVAHPFEAPERRGTAAYGEGDCMVEVRNLTTRPMELRYFSGMREPSPTWLLWPSLGEVEPRGAVRARVPCEDGRVRVRAWYRGRPAGDPPRDFFASAEGWVEEGEVVTLFLRSAG